MKKLITLSLLGVGIALVWMSACKKKNDPNLSSTVYLDLPEQSYAYFGAETSSTFIGINEKATLGRVLFYDSHLSINNAIACASCHKQALAFADNVAFSRGYESKLTGRNSPSIQNMVIESRLKLLGGNLMESSAFFFWDGRENNPKNLVARPLTNHVEMGITDSIALVAKLSALPYYEKLFKNAYGDGKVSLDRISDAIAHFIISIKATNTRFDQFAANKISLSALEMQGKVLFENKYECTNCHREDTASYSMSSEFRDIGLDAKPTDRGRGAITSNPMDEGTFKVPNLRNVSLTAPYMHDGRFNTLSDVLDHYSSSIHKSANLSEELKDKNGDPIRMNISDNEKQALIAFLGTFTDYSMITDPKYSNPFKTK